MTECILAATTPVGFFVTVAIGRSLIAAGVAEGVTALKLIDPLVLKLLRLRWNRNPAIGLPRNETLTNNYGQPHSRKTGKPLHIAIIAFCLSSSPRNVCRLEATLALAGLPFTIHKNFNSNLKSLGFFSAHWTYSDIHCIGMSAVYSLTPKTSLALHFSTPQS